MNVKDDVRTTVSYQGIVDAPHLLTKLRDWIQHELDPNRLEIHVDIQILVEGSGVAFELIAKDMSRNPAEVLVRYRAFTDLVVVFDERRRRTITDILEGFKYVNEFGRAEEVDFKIVLIHI